MRNTSRTWIGRSPQRSAAPPLEPRAVSAFGGGAPGWLIDGPAGSGPLLFGVPLLEGFVPSLLASGFGAAPGAVGAFSRSRGGPLLPRASSDAPFASLFASLDCEGFPLPLPCPELEQRPLLEPLHVPPAWCT